MKKSAKQKMKDASNVGYHQMKLDDDAYGKVVKERQRLHDTGRHVSFSDAVRELYSDALCARDPKGIHRPRK
jgi:hypothetical protein